MSWNRGDGPRDGFYTDDEVNGVYFLRVNNLKEHTIDLTEVKYIRREVHETTLERAQVTSGDLIFAISGTKDNLGTVSIVPNYIEEANLNSALVRLNLDETKVRKDFFCFFFDLNIARRQIEFIGKGAAQNNLNNEEISQIKIPLPSLEIQRSLVAEIEAARQSRKQKLAQADELLSSLDAYLLDQLGLNMPEESSNQTYAVQLKQIKNGRLDSLYHEPRFIKIVKELTKCVFPVIHLGDIVLSPVGGATPKRSDAELYAENGIKFLRILNIKPYEINLSDVKFITDAVHEGELARSQLKKDDILMTITGRVGTAAVVPQEILPANINQHIVRLRIKINDCLPTYLAAYLNSSVGLNLSNRNVTGGTRIALDYTAIRSLEVPLPPIDIQNAIIKEIEIRRMNAERLRQEAEIEWESAKIHFERKLLGEEV